MPSVLTKPDYARLRQLLVEARERAGLTQTQVAQQLQRAQSFVSKYELGERKLDVIDFVNVCVCLDVDPGDILRQVIRSKK